MLVCSALTAERYPRVVYTVTLGARGGAFCLSIPFRSRYNPGFDSSSNRNEYHEYFLGVKAVGACGWQSYQLHVSSVWKSGSLSLLEPSGLSRPFQILLYLYISLHATLVYSND